MEIKQLMTDYVETLIATDSILKASYLMKKLGVGAIPVIDEASQVVGIITDRDLVTRGIVDKLAADTPVREIMTQPVYTINECEPVGTAISLMSDKQVRRLPVVDNLNQLTGIISLGDLATLQLTDERAGLALKEISEPNTNPNRDLEVDDFPL